MSRCTLCAEVSVNGLALYLCTKKTVESALFALPEGAFGDAKRMAEPARKWLAQKASRRISSAVVLANTRRTALRFAKLTEEAAESTNKKPHLARSVGFKTERKSRDLSAYYRALFPYGELFNEATHVFGGEALPGKRADVLFLAALPTGLAEAFTGMCGEWGVPLRALKRISALELALLKYFPSAETAYTLLCLPQDNGVRLIHIRDGEPDCAGFISDDPAYRERELDRAFWARTYAPENETALILLPALLPVEETGERYGWLRVCLEAKGIGCETSPIPERIYVDAAREH